MNLTDKQLIDLYTLDKKGIKEIAEENNTYPNKVRRKLKKLGVPLRNNSEAQLIALNNGKSKHPTAGRKRRPDELLKIAEGMGQVWDNMTHEEKERRGQMMRDRWESYSDQKKAEILKKSAQANSRAGREGSQIEKILDEALTKEGYNVIFHKTGLIEDDLEIDILIPDLKLAIEIDGPSHHLPIYGEDKLQKKREADQRKNGLLISAGYSVIRVKYLVKNLSLRKSTRFVNTIIDYIQKVKSGNIIFEQIEV